MSNPDGTLERGDILPPLRARRKGQIGRGSEDENPGTGVAILLSTVECARRRGEEVKGAASVVYAH